MEQEKPDRNELVTLSDARRILGYSRTSMYRLFDSGELEPIRIYPAKLKQPLYFYRRDIERLLMRRRATMQRAS